MDAVEKTNKDAKKPSTDLEKECIANREANREEINTFLTEQGQLKRLSDVYEHLVRIRDEKI